MWLHCFLYRCYDYNTLFYQRKICFIYVLKWIVTNNNAKGVYCIVNLVVEYDLNAVHIIEN